jgi:hypothetical protein
VYLRVPTTTITTSHQRHDGHDWRPVYEDGDGDRDRDRERDRDRDRERDRERDRDRDEDERRGSRRVRRVSSPRYVLISFFLFLFSLFHHPQGSSPGVFFLFLFFVFIIIY